MARIAIVSSNKKIATVLKAIVAGEEISYFHKRQLVETGHLVETKGITDAVKAAGRGRHKVSYELSTKGKTLVNLAKNWKMVA